MASELPPVRSCLQRANGITSSLKRAILEVIVSGAAKTQDDVIDYATSTLLAASLECEAGDDVTRRDDASEARSKSVLECVQFLVDSEFVTRRTSASEGAKLVVTGFNRETS